MGKTLHFWTIAALAVVSTACGGEVQDKGATPSPDGTKVTATLVDEIWVFFHNSPNYNLALLEAPATIEARCLKVGDAIVLWNSEHANSMAEVVRAAKAGERPLIRLGGGAIVREWVGDEGFPSEVLDRCPAARMLWGAAPPSAFDRPLDG